MFQAYDINATYRENYDAGPRFSGEVPPGPETPLKEFLGCQVRSRIGIAAGLLLNSKWIEGYARRGFDILTYKTVRSAFRPCYDPPNWVFVDGNGKEDEPVYATDDLGSDPAGISSAVCFGMPSMGPEVWQADVALAKGCLDDGQMLIVSVVATPESGATPQSVAEDFAQCAAWARDAGADVVEANFSCPNVCTPEGTIYQDVSLSSQIAKVIRRSVSDLPLLLKVGYFPNELQQTEFLRELNGIVDGVTMVNGISRPVLHRDGRPVFGKDYVNAGVLGRAIHDPSVASVAAAKRAVAEHGFDLEILAVGGVSQVADMHDFFEAGAGAVMLGSSPMYLPDLAIEAKRVHPEW